MRRVISLLLLLVFSVTTFSQNDNGCGLKFTRQGAKASEDAPAESGLDLIN